MESISKIQQKYKGVRRIEKRPLRIINSKPRVNIHEVPYVHRRKFIYEKYFYDSPNGEYLKYKLIYQ